MPWRQTKGGSKEGLIGDPSADCQTCGVPFEKGQLVYDCKTIKGPWAWLCPICFFENGIGLGFGLGQEYKWSENDDDEA
jgi:hypothetical protein